MAGEFLPAQGFDTYEAQDKVLVGLDGSRESKLTVRILQQQGFHVVAAFVTEDEEQAEAVKKDAEELGVSCIGLRAASAGSAALLELLACEAKKQNASYIATGHRAILETLDKDSFALCPAVDGFVAHCESLSTTDAKTLAHLILPLGSFTPEDINELAVELGL